MDESQVLALIDKKLHEVKIEKEEADLREAAELLCYSACFNHPPGDRTEEMEKAIATIKNWLGKPKVENEARQDFLLKEIFSVAKSI